jgi:hypothetical protein
LSPISASIRFSSAMFRATAISSAGGRGCSGRSGLGRSARCAARACCRPGHGRGRSAGAAPWPARGQPRPTSAGTARWCSAAGDRRAGSL